MLKKPSQIIMPPTGSQNAGPPSVPAAGGGANQASTGVKKKWECNGSKHCTDLHCMKPHVPERPEPSVCWYVKNKGSCRICNPRQPSENCPNFQACQNESCKFKHHENRRIHNLAPAGDFPSLGESKPITVVPVKSDKDFTGTAATFAEVAATHASASTSKNSYGVPEINQTIDRINMMARDLQPDEKGMLTSWITLLTPMSGMPNLHELSTNVGQTITSALSFCQHYYDLIMKKNKDLREQKDQKNRASIFDPQMFDIRASASDSMHGCMAHAFAWSFFHGRNLWLLHNYDMGLEPITDIPTQEFVFQELMGCFNESISESLKEFLSKLKSVQEFRSFVHEMRNMFQVLKTDFTNFTKLLQSQPDDEDDEDVEKEDPKYEDFEKEVQQFKHVALKFFNNTILCLGDINFGQLEKPDILELYMELIESSKLFSNFFENFEKFFFDVKTNKYFFNIVVSVMTEKLKKDDAEQLKNCLISGDISEQFYAEHILPFFQKCMDRTKRYLERTDEAVLQSMVSFKDMQNQFLTGEFTNFLFSTFDTGGQEGRLSFGKAIDNYFTVLKKYFGIIEDPIGVPFGQKWVIKHKSLTGDKVSEDVSDFVGDYIFKLLCIAKVLVDDKKDLSIRFGNCGVCSIRDIDKKIETPASLSFLFDEIGRKIADDRTFGFTKETKDKPEVVPNVFCQKIRSKFSSGDPSHKEIMKIFMDQSIQEIVKQNFDKRSEQDSFNERVRQVMEDFRVKGSQDDTLLHLFLSMFKRNPNDKFLMSLVEFILHEPCKLALLDSLSFVDERFKMSDVMKSTISSILRFSTNIPESQDVEVISAIRDAFRFIIQSGITLCEVLDICTVFKDLFNANKKSMVFINTFGIALMTASSKTYGLTFETMYAIVTNCLNPTSRIIKSLASFHKTFQADVSKILRPSTNFFAKCKKPTPSCESFCQDATSSQVEKKHNISEFKRMAEIVFPVIMCSPIHHRGDKKSSLTLALSEIFDRMIMMLIASNRKDVLQMLGLMEKMATLTEEKIEKTHEEQFLCSLTPSLMTLTLKSYHDSFKTYLMQNHKSIEQLLVDSEIKQLRTKYRMEALLQSLYTFLKNAGILTIDDIRTLNSSEVSSTIFMPDWRGNLVIDIDPLITMISSCFNVSESFVKGVCLIISRALYPNHTDIMARRDMMNQLYENKMALSCQQFSERNYLLTASSCLPKASFADIAFDFDSPNVKQLLEEFMSLVDKQIAQIIQQRIDELPVTLMSKKFLDALLAGTSMKDVECMTDFANEILNGSNPSEFSSYFSTVCAYIETVFYDDEENGVNLEEFRNQLNESSTELAKSFSSYVEASILDFESKK